MKQGWQVLLVQISMALSALWLFGGLAAGLIATRGNLRSAGGGTLMFSLVPAAIFLGLLLWLGKRDRKKAALVSAAFWIMLLVSLIFLAYMQIIASHLEPHIGAENEIWALLLCYLTQSAVAISSLFSVMISMLFGRRRSVVQT